MKNTPVAVASKKDENSVTIDLSLAEAEAFTDVELGSKVTITLTGKLTSLTRTKSEDEYSTSYIRLGGYKLVLPDKNEFTDLAEDE